MTGLPAHHRSVNPDRRTVSAIPLKPLAALVLAASVFAVPSPARTTTLNDITSVQIVGNVPLDPQIQAARMLGVSKVRIAVRWYEVELRKGKYSWRVADDRIAKLRRAGLVPMITLFGGNDVYPSREGVDGKGAPSTDEAMDGFARFAAATVARYGVGTPEAPITYEIWNEPNTKTFWGRPPEPEAYAEMAEKSCRAIKAETPQATVYALAMEGTPAKPEYFVRDYKLDIYRQWARRAASPGLARCADGISMHPYFDAPEMHHRFEPELQRYLAAHWKRDAPLAIALTEWGYSMDVARGRPADKQAALNLRALLIGASARRLTNLYQSVDGGSDSTKSEQTFGFVDRQGRMKPAGTALRRLLDAIGDYEITGMQVTSAKPRLYRFTARKGNARAEVLWTLDPPATVRVGPDARAVDLVSGARRAVGKDGLAVDATPVIVTWQAS